MGIVRSVASAGTSPHDAGDPARRSEQVVSQPGAARCTRCAASTSRSRAARPSRCSGRTAPASRRRSTCCSACAAGRRHRVASSAARRARPSTPAWSARCCRRAALIRDLSVRELITMMASLYPAPLDVDEVLELDRPRAIAARSARRSSPAARPSVCASRSRSSSNPDLLVLDEPTVAMDVEARHEFWDVDARVRRARQDRPLRDPLPRGGRRRTPTARPDGARAASSPTGRRPRSRRASARARSARRCPTCRSDELAALPGVGARRPPRRGRRSLGCSDSDQAIRALLERYPAARDIEITGRRRSRRRSSRSPPTTPTSRSAAAR